MAIVLFARHDIGQLGLVSDWDLRGLRLRM